MLDADWDAILNTAFAECEALGQPLNAQQQMLLRQAIARIAQPNGISTPNPLEELSPEERQTLLDFIHEQEQLNRPWKAQLLNDWLAGHDSGSVQFLRDAYGLAWLERVQPEHVLAYRQPQQLRVGDRIEVANSLWEWVQEDGPCLREWVPCTVIHVEEYPSEERPINRCTVRFDNGMEYEIQGIYDWNRYNWRWSTDLPG